MKRIGTIIAAITVLVLGVAAAFALREWRREVAWESTAPIRAVNTACRTYAQTYPSFGFPRRLVQLGNPSVGEAVSPEHSGLLDDVLASGQKSGYDFVYVPETGEAGRIVGYTLLVRPERFGENGNRSFYSDQSGDIRFTDENRPATSSDPPLY